jgi:hypothetical protein
MKIQGAILLLITTLFSSCAMNEDLMPPEVEGASVDRTLSDLSVWIDSGIQNEFEVKPAGLPTARFLKYRTTLENAFRTTFSQYFNGVRFTDHAPDKGVFVRLSQAAPTPVAIAPRKIGLQVAWTAEIYRDGVKVRNSVGKALSDEKATSEECARGTPRASAVMSDALRVMMEQFGKEVRAIADGADPATPVARATVIPLKKAGL